MNNLFSNIYKKRKVFITGHTGFKGSWLSLWLKEMGAEITGYSKDFPTKPDHYSLLNLNINSVKGDINCYDDLYQAIYKTKPEIIFHLAAQAIVRESYSNPINTFTTNAIGTANILDICRKVKSIKACIIITSDKCYQNNEWVWGYRENDPMGGYDPYSASKGCAELITNSFRNSFFNLNKYKKTHNVLIASARAGNVIGGGDWGNNRIIPDIMKAAILDKPALIRNPDAIRPWEHVLEPLSGYLLLGEQLLKKKLSAAQAWNFGPSNEEILQVKNLTIELKKHWEKLQFKYSKNISSSMHEAKILKLDCSKALIQLKWKPVWGINKTIKSTTEWYKAYYQKGNIRSRNDLKKYINDAKKQQLGWSSNNDSGKN